MDRGNAKRSSRRKIILIVSVTLLILILLLIGYKTAVGIINERQREERSQFIKNSAVTYLREKYDIDADVAGLSYDRYARNMTTVYMKYIDKEFQVHICSDDGAICMADNYQYDEITEAVLDKISKELPGGYNYECILRGHSIHGYAPEVSSYFGKDKYFNGTNLDDILYGCEGRITMLYVDTEFEDCDLFDWLRIGKDIDTKFVSFDSQNILDEFVERHDGPLLLSYFFDEYAPYISDRRDIKWMVNTGARYTIKKHDNFLYCCPDNPDVSVSDIDKDYFIDHFVTYHEEQNVSIPITNAYKFDSSRDEYVYIFFPYSEIKEHRAGKVKAAWYSPGAQSGNQGRGLFSYDVCGDYAVFRLGTSKPEFMLVEENIYL